MSTILSRAGRVALATCLLWGVSVTPAFAQPAPPVPTDEQRAGALIRPAVVYLNTDVSANVSTVTGVSETYAGTGTCTGFVVNPNGYIATAAHCVDVGEDSNLYITVVTAVATDILAANPTLTEDQLVAAVDSLTFEGSTPGTPLDRVVKVYTGSGAGTGMRGEATTAEVVAFVAAEKGDVALLKIPATDLPSAELGTDEDVRQGVRVLSVGYPGSRTDVIDESIEPTFKEGQISSRTARDGIPIYEISASLLPGMSGGPTVGTDGRVFGVNSFIGLDDTGAKAEGLNFLQTTTTLNKLLMENNVKAELGPLDRTYREGLTLFYDGEYTDAIARFDQVISKAPNNRAAQDFKADAMRLRTQFGDAGIPQFWYYTGGGILLLVLVVGAVLLLRSRRATPAPAFPPGPQFRPPPPPPGPQFGPPPPPPGPQFGPPPQRGGGPAAPQWTPPRPPQVHAHGAPAQEAPTRKLTPPQRSTQPQPSHPDHGQVPAPPVPSGQHAEPAPAQPETKALIWPPPPPS